MCKFLKNIRNMLNIAPTAVLFMYACAACWYYFKMTAKEDDGKKADEEEGEHLTRCESPCNKCRSMKVRGFNSYKDTISCDCNKETDDDYGFYVYV